MIPQDYGEIFCQAVDAIVAKRLAPLMKEISELKEKIEKLERDKGGTE